MSILVTVLAVLAVFHIIFAMTFLGSVFVFDFVLAPALNVFSPSTYKEFLMKGWPIMAKFLHASVVGTALFGLLLYGGGGFYSVSAVAVL